MEIPNQRLEDRQLDRKIDNQSVGIGHQVELRCHPPNGNPKPKARKIDIQIERQIIRVLVQDIKLK